MADIGTSDLDGSTLRKMIERMAVFGFLLLTDLIYYDKNKFLIGSRRSAEGPNFPQNHFPGRKRGLCVYWERLGETTLFKRPGGNPAAFPENVLRVGWNY